MLVLVFATLCAGLFCGAALSINLVEHSARMSCGPDLAVREFAPSYRRATWPVTGAGFADRRVRL